MVRTGKTIKHLIMSFSIQERKKRNLDHYRQELRTFHNMEKDELDLEYINLKTEYKHKKNIMSIFLLTIVLSVLMDLWKFLYGFIVNVVSYNAVHQASELEIVQVVFVIFVILIAFISSIIMGVLIFYTRRMRRIYRSLQIIEELRIRKTDK